MSGHAFPTAPTGLSGRLSAGLGLAAVVLTIAFVVAPAELAASDGLGTEDQLRKAFSESFIGYWSAGARELSPDLAQVVDYWFRYHVAKGVIAAALLVVLAMLGLRLWRAYLAAGDSATGRRALLGSAGGGVTALGLFALVVVMANIQGAVAPFASLLPMLLDEPAQGELATTIDGVEQGLAESGQARPPALAVMIDDFAVYHVAMAIIAALVAVVLAVGSTVLWRRFARSRERRTRRLLGGYATLAAVLALAALVVVTANITTAADPAPALAALFTGSW
ncbi:hypothetical protein [Nocardia huaxiensis]|uniref:hypothetical protein n=1 Tax=Nocardia huaxiensis TaxID=2755382 RepID=UPI001E61157D|nr:hypothetical protein [Nocardia huaxiensis]UFS99036.1 hypothetical protein LPY97_14620 [Nocardia huaxiensis]